MKNTFLLFLFGSILLSSTACSDDDEKSDEPADTVTLNMLNEDNGKTLLGTSDVFINKANNFYTPDNLIAEVGKANGVGAKIPPKLENLASQVAVTPGHSYQVFDEKTLLEFPSGVRTIMIGAAYYCLYVVSPIVVNNNTTGAIVKYVAVYPDKNGLHEYDHRIGEVSYIGDQVSIQLPKDAECIWDDEVAEAFNISTNGGILKMTLTKEPDQASGPWGYNRVYIRSGNVYTRVYVNVIR